MSIKIFSIFILWRSFLFFIAFLAKDLIAVFGNRFPYVGILKESGLPYWIWSFGNFDGVHYLRIVQSGYANQYTQVFFPLYPLFIRLVSDIFRIPFLTSALLISNLAFLAALYFLNKLVLLDFETKIAKWTIIFLLLFPTSFFFGAIYTESLFLFFIITSLYSARKGNFFLAGLLGGLASATRFFGILLFPALIYEYYLRHKKGLLVDLPLTIYKAMPLVFVFAGTGGYIFYLWREFGKPFYFWTAQEAFGAGRIFGFVFPLQVFFRYLKIFATVSPLSLPFFNATFEFAATVFVLGLLIFGIKKLRLSYLIFSFPAVFLPVFSGTLSSMPRYVLIAFPVFIAMALLKNPLLKIILCLLFFILGFFSLILFSRGYWLA